MLSKEEPLVFSYDDLVIGSTLEALFFSYYFSVPGVSARLSIPHVVETTNIYENPKAAWENYSLILSLSGLLPLKGMCKSITYVDKETLKIISLTDKIYKIKFKKLWVFDDYKFNGLPPYVKENKDFMIIDHLRSLDTWSSDKKSIVYEDKFIDKIIFFRMKENIKTSKYKDMYVITYPKTPDNYPEYLVKIKCENLLGGVKLEHKNREIKSLSFNTYEDFDNVTFCYNKIDDMFLYSFKRKKISYQKYLKLKLKL